MPLVSLKLKPRSAWAMARADAGVPRQPDSPPSLQVCQQGCWGSEPAPRGFPWWRGSWGLTMRKMLLGQRRKNRCSEVRGLTLVLVLLSAHSAYAVF